MDVADELPARIRASIREHLALLADFEAQRRYEHDVSIAAVPAELFSIWFDDVYHPKTPAHRRAFTSRELKLLEEFNAYLDRIFSDLGEMHGVAELQAREEWRQLGVAAAMLLSKIPDVMSQEP